MCYAVASHRVSAASAGANRTIVPMRMDCLSLACVRERVLVQNP